MTTGNGPAPLPQTQHYIRFSIAPPSSDALHVRRALQEALVQSFGAARSHTYLDVLWVADSGTECIVRTGGPTDAASVMAAAAVFQGQPRLSTLRESPFLPAISGDSDTQKLFLR
ncbi:hypothetical protein EDB92DRAFT_1800623 [Lactarius akahatsu]|uniref:Uncharacterized protein n=1 Tax=Lactarius akahatsu TaxID=416441 RepID=A0AAD4LI39_9AGAM|nr:hypothetical protein EDB92DRAFT_1800623 [Lactarius akahatsu]